MSEDWGLVTLPTSGDPEKIAIGRLKAASDRMLDERRARGKMDGSWMTGGTGQDVFRWWMEEDVLPGQISVDDILEN